MGGVRERGAGVVSRAYRHRVLIRNSSEIMTALEDARGGGGTLVRLKGLDYPLCASISVASVCWVAAHDARSAKLSAVGVPAGAV